MTSAPGPPAAQLPPAEVQISRADLLRRAPRLLALDGHLGKSEELFIDS